MIEAALILAGGRGSRLAPWDAPKALLPVNGISILRRILEHVANYVSRSIVCTGYRATDIESAMKHERQNYRGGTGWLEFSRGDEDELMCSRLIGAKHEKKINGRTLILYGDELADVDVAALLSFHKQSGGALTFTGFQQVLPFGVVRDNRIYDDARVLVNIGFVVVEAVCWEHVQPEHGLAEWINCVGQEHEIACFTHSGRRATINSLADLRYAEEIWR